MSEMEGLPVELTIEIFTFLPLCDLRQVSLVCKRWYQILYKSPETLSLWRHLLARDFDVTAKPVGDEEVEWLEIYKNYAGWSWSEKLKHSAVVLSDRNHVATVRGASDFYLAVLTNRPLSPGTHYFEITILDARDAHSVEYGIGVGDMKVLTIAGWHAENNGVGWYSQGTLYREGLSPERMGDVITKWDKGDVVGIFVSIGQPENEDNYIRWFLNEKEVNGKVTLVMRVQPLYLVCFMARCLSVRLRYVGRTFPSHYTLNNEVLTDFEYG